MGVPDSPTPTSPQPPNRPRRFRFLLTCCCWAYLVGVLGSWLLLFWADEWWLATVWMFAPRWLLALPLVILLPSVLVVRRSLSAVLLLTGVLIAGPIMGFCIPWRPWLQSAPAGRTLRVLTCNMHYYNSDATALDTLVADVSPDVVAVQEWAGSTGSALRTAPGWHIHPGSRLFLASRHPIRRAVELGRHSMREDASLMRYELETPVGVVHLLSLHLASARQGLFDATHDKGRGAEELQSNTDMRRRQSEYVASVAAELRGPVLLVGDFNTPPQSVLFSSVWGNYRDAFAEAGLGWGYTFHAARTMVRIDHILTDRGWFCRECRVGPDVGSPHRPVIADLVRPADDN
jgi:endonuclease/exonuclease/phosphatase (EEP) superfamily protein YafD